MLKFMYSIPSSKNTLGSNWFSETNFSNRSMATSCSWLNFGWRNIGLVGLFISIKLIRLPKSFLTYLAVLSYDARRCEQSLLVLRIELKNLIEQLQGHHRIATVTDQNGDLKKEFHYYKSVSPKSLQWSSNSLDFHIFSKLLSILSNWISGLPV